MIFVIDYGMGNLRSVSKALEHLGAEVRVGSDPADLKNAEKIVLPGVGAFGDAVEGLKSRNLLQPVKDCLKTGQKFLGICLGMQLLLETSEETPGAAGLGYFQGSVDLFRSKTIKVPHMGWNQVTLRREHPLMHGVEDQSFFYFVHSFFVNPVNRDIVVGSCSYGDEEFAAIIGNDHVFATQFHPEKSQQAGLQILKNFIEW